MKKETSALFTQISTAQTEILTQEVKETLANGLNGHNKIFTSADLWNIRRQRKNISSRRQFV